MAFTIGHRESYDRYLSESALPIKCGPHHRLDEGRAWHYEGGAVFETAEAAREYLTIEALGDYAVYELGSLAEMSLMTHQVDGETFRRLAADARIVRRVDADETCAGAEKIRPRAGFRQLQQEGRA